EEIAKYIRDVGGKYIIIPDRKEAVAYALSNMQKGDILVLAGKGDETFMKTKNGKVPYSEL
ncbi:MAG TPA: UDP-N-acetylmuramoyl-L-alanyl-D-glutamate--2,6-diaminopimelate ligase, partial [Ruminococcaceae bacterium]|nr:UDP-N-acetylmuramoyl-L-alanyl-D-glutamate--2,6-diaminopimelate ligase [Oscillospiraceae bacterium]